MKKIIQTLLLTAGLYGAVAPSYAQDYPNKAIRMIVPLAAGSAVDNAARILTAKMGQNMGQAIVIENIAGSSGLIGADRLAKSAPDGYTLGGVNDSVLTMIPHIYPNMPWNALKDFDPVSLVGTIEWGIVVPPNSPYTTLAELLAAARSDLDRKCQRQSVDLEGPNLRRTAEPAEPAGKRSVSLELGCYQVECPDCADAQPQ